MQNAGEILKLNKSLNELTEERDTIQFKYDNLVSKFDLLNRQQDFFKNQLLELKG